MPGRLHAGTSSEIMCVDVQKILAIIADNRCPESTDAIRNFAGLIIEHFAEECPDTDLWTDKAFDDTLAEKYDIPWSMDLKHNVKAFLHHKNPRPFMAMIRGASNRSA